MAPAAAGLMKCRVAGRVSELSEEGGTLRDEMSHTGGLSSPALWGGGSNCYGLHLLLFPPSLSIGSVKTTGGDRVLPIDEWPS